MEGECEVRNCEVEEDKKTNGGRGGDELGYHASQSFSKCGIAHYLFMHN